MRYSKEYCEDCKKVLKFNGEGTYVSSWKLYCEDCYLIKAKEGKIIPPSHSKFFSSSNEKVAIYMRVGRKNS